MARNEEKHAGRLNRLWLQQLNEEKAQKNPPRPGLGSLNSASEIKKWIPSIKRDIDFYLKQSQVTCYPDRQIKEFSSKIENLTKEYKAYIRKLRQLEPNIEEVPWTERGYTRKHKLENLADGEGYDDLDTENEEELAKKCRLEFSPLSTPVLDNDGCYEHLYGYQDNSTPAITDESTDSQQNQPLEFNNQIKIIARKPNKSELRGQNSDGEIMVSVNRSNDNLLNLPYSDSSDDEG